MNRRGEVEVFGSRIMKRQWLVIVAAIVVCPVLLFAGLLFLQKPYVSLGANGKTIAVVKRPLVQPITDGATDVYVGKQRIFSIWQDFFNFPCFIYPFADGKRFLCDYDDDTSLLDFVVDFRDSATNEPRSFGWPPDDNAMGNYVRTYMASRITNIVFNTKGTVRLPTYAELREVSDYLTGKNFTSVKVGYLQSLSFREREGLLLDLATNRQSVWPLVK